jgi:hypothetical protein
MKNDGRSDLSRTLYTDLPGSAEPLTQQMSSESIYAEFSHTKYPCSDPKKDNHMDCLPHLAVGADPLEHLLHLNQPKLHFKIWFFIRGWFLAIWLYILG